MDNSPAKILFHSINSIQAVKKMIDDGESEHQYLECKSPGTPVLDKGLKNQLSEAISGFSNSGGGVIIWGLSTTKHEHSDLDFLSQIEAIGSILKFEREINSAIPILTKPNVQAQSKILKEKPSDTKGVIVTFIPLTTGDPVQGNDGKFYLRTRHEFNEMPYETIKRMFSGTSSPDLQPIFDGRQVTLEKDGSWKIPILLANKSSAAAKDNIISVVILNPLSCEIMNSSGSLRDASQVNPGVKIFNSHYDRPIHRGMNQVMGNLLIKMKKIKRSKRILHLQLRLFSTNMRAKIFLMNVQLAKRKFSIKSTEEKYLY